MAPGRVAHPNWLELPTEITSKILQKLGTVEMVLTAQNVCSQWRSICKDPSMYRTIDMHNLENRLLLDRSLRKICHDAVDRSSGDLLSINLEYFANDDTLNYITDRCKNIRCLRLRSCYAVSDKGLCDMVTKLPLLEELELFNCWYSIEAIKFIGKTCPLLKSFTLKRYGYKARRDDDAQAIAESMHQLCHLRIPGNYVTNEGLKAILDGCPYLESLDLRQCFNVNLEGNLGKLCVERIRSLCHPGDYIGEVDTKKELARSLWHRDTSMLEALYYYATGLGV